MRIIFLSKDRIVDSELMFAMASHLCIHASEIIWRRQKRRTFSQMWSTCTALSTMLPSMCSAFLQFLFHQSFIELKVYKKHGIESQRKDIFPLFSCAVYKQEQWKQWKTKLHPFALHNFLKFFLSQINQATEKTQVKVKMGYARMLWNLGTVIFSHHLLLYDKLLRDPGV